jgi:hypothetical protein
VRSSSSTADEKQTAIEGAAVCRSAEGEDEGDGGRLPGLKMWGREETSAASHLHREWRVTHDSQMLFARVSHSVDCTTPAPTGTLLTSVPCPTLFAAPVPPRFTTLGEVSTAPRHLIVFLMSEEDTTTVCDAHALGVNEGPGEEREGAAQGGSGLRKASEPKDDVKRCNGDAGDDAAAGDDADAFEDNI